jgi:hypothetical protein
MLDEWIEFDSSYVGAGKFSFPPGTTFPTKQRQLGTLYCRMKNGSKGDVVCVYPDTPYIVWEQLLAAESKGKFHHAAIRGRFYFIEV